jgi:hypothetical protein
MSYNILPKKEQCILQYNFFFNFEIPFLLSRIFKNYVALKKALTINKAI